MAGKTRQPRSNETAILELCARGCSLKQVAVESGCSIRTVQRRWADPEFCRRVQDLRGEMVNRAAGRLSRAAASAVDCLERLLNDESANVRLGASRAILEQAVRYRELLHIEGRLQWLETSLQELEGGSHGRPH